MSRGEIESRRLVAEYECLKPAPILEPEEVEAVEELAEGAIECDVVNPWDDKRYRRTLEIVANAGKMGANSGGGGLAIKNRNKQNIITLYRLGFIAFRETLTSKCVTKRFYTPECIPHNMTIDEQKERNLLQLCLDAGSGGVTAKKWKDAIKYGRGVASNLIKTGRIVRVSETGATTLATYHHSSFLPTITRLADDRISKANDKRQSLLQCVINAGSSGVSSRKMQQFFRRIRNEVASMIDSGEVVRIDSKGSGTPKTTFYHRDFAPTTAKEPL